MSDVRFSKIVSMIRYRPHCLQLADCCGNRASQRDGEPVFGAECARFFNIKLLLLLRWNVHRLATAAPPLFPSCAIVHPLVLLSATDHYMRVAKVRRTISLIRELLVVIRLLIVHVQDTNKRVVGVLLGAREIAGERDSWRLSTHENQVLECRLFDWVMMCFAVFASWRCKYHE